MKNYILLSILFNVFVSVSQQDYKSVLDSLQATDTLVNSVEIDDYYQNNKGNDLPSKSEGTVSNGKLINGKLIPFKGKNFTYFDTQSYLNGRAYLNQNVLKTLLSAYKSFETLLPNRMFYVMECSNHNEEKSYVKKAIKIVVESGGLEYAKKRMIEIQQEAIVILNDFEDNDAKQALLGLVEYTVTREK